MYYQVENGHDRDGLGSEENYFWKTAKERNTVSVDINVATGSTDQYNITGMYYDDNLKINTDDSPELG